MPDVSSVYEFGEFRLDLAKEVLERDGTEIGITKKMFDTLLVLVENPDRVVTKRELMEKIWHDRFVEDSNLTFNIKMLRKALGDSAADPTYIQTVQRRGYRFIAEVRRPTHQPAATYLVGSTALGSVSPVERRRSTGNRYTFIPVVAVVLLLICTAVFASLVWQQRAAARPALFPFGFELTRITDTGTAYHAAISPDGKYVAYTTIVNDMQSLWLRHLESASNTTILPASDDIYLGLEFSPNGDALYFVRRRDAEFDADPAAVYRIPVFGGVPEKIADNTQGWIAVSPDDRFVSFVRCERGYGCGLFVVGTDGSGERELMSAEKGNFLRAQSFSPDGRSIAIVFGHSVNASQATTLIEVNAETGDRRDISEKKFFHIKDVEWLPNSRGLVLSADEKVGDTVRIWHVDHRSGEVKPVTHDLTDFAGISLSKDSARLLTTSVRPDFKLTLHDAASPSGFKMLTQARDRFAFAPDGRIVFATDSAGNEDIWIMDGDGGNQRQLTNSEGIDFYPIVSTDGRYVYFTSNRTGESHVWRMNIDGSNQIQVTRQKGGHAVFATGMDSHLYYQSAFSERLMKVSLETGEESRIEGETGIFQSISPDGRTLACFYDVPGAKHRKVRVIDLATGEVLNDFAIPPAKGYAYYLRWRDNNTFGYVINASDGEDSIWVQHLSERSPRLLQKLDSGGIKDLQFTPDGKGFGLIRGSWKHDAVLLSGH